MRVATKEMTLNEVEKSHRLENIKAKLEVDDVSNISAALKALPLKDVVLIIDDVMVLADMFVPALIHSFGQIAAVNVDWDNLKNGIDSMYSRGVKYPVVFLSANGEIGTASLDNSRHMSWLRPIADRDAEVYVSDSSSGLETVYITTWELLRGGELVQALD
ncbi:MAG TPA: hypothetical protein DF427_09710 [Moraxellaceae bacterium]|nr:hypothetical protein [Moraxellaceae bacterium]